MTNLPRRIVLACFAAAILASAAAADSGHRDGDDHDQARAALERGEILPLDTILERVQGRLPGRILEVEIEREDGVWVYEFTVLRPDGRRVDVYVEGATAAILAEDED